MVAMLLSYILKKKSYLDTSFQNPILSCASVASHDKLVHLPRVITDCRKQKYDRVASNGVVFITKFVKIIQLVQKLKKESRLKILDIFIFYLHMQQCAAL